MRVFRSLLFYPTLILSTVVVGLSAIVLYRITGRHDGPHRCARLWGRINLWTAGIRVRLEGTENIRPQEACIYAPNHQSWFDIFALLGMLPVQFRWLAKEELFKIPVLGAAMHAIDSIPIDREDRRKAFASMNRAAERVKNGTSLVIFPEGTRSPDGLLQDFKKGSFVLAIKSQQPVVPVSISGSYEILPKKAGWMVHPGTIQVRIAPPIETRGLTSKDRDALSESVREAIRSNLPVHEGGTMNAPGTSST